MIGKKRNMIYADGWPMDLVHDFGDTRIVRQIEKLKQIIYDELSGLELQTILAACVMDHVGADGKFGMGNVIENHIHLRYPRLRFIESEPGDSLWPRWNIAIHSVIEETADYFGGTPSRVTPILISAIYEELERRLVDVERFAKSILCLVVSASFHICSAPIWTCRDLRINPYDDGWKEVAWKLWPNSTKTPKTKR